MKTKIYLILIFLLAVVLRFYQLGQVPSGFVNDEAAFGYNAYSLLKTGKDEFGKSWPLVFRSFGEGKMPVYFYLTMPSILLFGLNEFAVRLPSALFGSLTVLLIYYLVKEINKSKKQLWPLLSALVLAAMPWHIHFSRAAFETNVSVFWAVLGTIFFLRFIKSSKNWQLVISLTSLTLAVFTYNAPRIFIPLWLAYLIWQYRHKLPLAKTLFSVLLLVVIPWVSLFFTQSSLNRFAGISIFNPQSGVYQRLEEKYRETSHQSLMLTRALHNKPMEFTWDVAKRYASHFDSNFLFFQGDPNRPRYRVPDTGQSLWLTLPFFFIGLYSIVKKRQWLILTWLFLAPIASSITFETPSAFRAMLMVVPLAVAIGSGLTLTFKALPGFFPWLIGLAFIINLGQYLDAYFIHAPVHQPYEWQGGYKELVKRVDELMPNYDKAMITDSRGTAYIYFLFYNQYDPAKWQSRSNQAITLADKFGFSSINNLDNLFFISEKCPAKTPKNKVLYVCTEEDRPRVGFTELPPPIYFDDNQPAFVLFESEKNSQ